MRNKDDKKHQAICDAAIKLITENGFADTSMSKIAKAANVSPATIYVYFENKDDLLNKIYLFVKQQMTTEIFEGVKNGQSVEESFKIIWDNFYRYALTYPIRLSFTEQFANSPLVGRICQDETHNFMRPFIELFEKGKQRKLIKDIPFEIFLAFTFSPLMGLLKQHYSGALVVDDQMLATVRDLAWDAVTN